MLPLVGGQGGPDFGSSVNPFTTRGADYAHHITASPPGFENPAASLRNVYKIISCFKTATDYVYISESNENWEKYLTQR